MRFVPALCISLLCTLPSIAMAEEALSDTASPSSLTETSSTESDMASDEGATKRAERREKKIAKIAARRGLDSLDPDVSEALQIRHAIETRNIGRATTTGGVLLTAGGGFVIGTGVAIYSQFCPGSPALCIIVGIPIGVAVGAVGGIGATMGIVTASAGLTFRSMGMKHLEDLGRPTNLRKRDAPAAE